MMKYNIPTAAYKSFTKDTLEEGHQFLETLSPPYVINRWISWKRSFNSRNFKRAKQSFKRNGGG